VPLPLDEAALIELRAELSAASGIGAALDETEQAAPEALEAGDLALDISSDVDAALIDAFLHDSPPQAAEVTQSLQRWIADPTQSELLRNAKRAAHTLKGSANILGIRGVARLAHRLEDILEICETKVPTFIDAGRRVSAADASSRWWPQSPVKTPLLTTPSPSSNCSTPRASTMLKAPGASACWKLRRK
jgi:chemosensory pili system protein ChpA (sensor histidine kinase/response regulator)